MSITKKLKPFNKRKMRPAAFALTTIIALFGAAIVSQASGVRWYISTSPADFYVQNWSNTNGVTADDNWDNLLAITGYRGDDLTTGIGVDPQTILADGEGTPVDVIANQSNPNTLTTGGVAEFDGIANPTIALKGSATADAPHLLIKLNRASCPSTKFITVSYRVRDLDSTANNAVQAVALQYRLGTTGNFTNVSNAFVDDATDPNTATKITDVIGNLPHIAGSPNEVDLRIMTTNAAGTDEWIGIDDINIGCLTVTASTVPVSGRVLSGKGVAVARALVSMTDEYGSTVTTRTNSFGYYQFENVRAGENYVFNVESKRYSFEERVVSITDSIADLDFYAQE